MVKWFRFAQRIARNGVTRKGYGATRILLFLTILLAPLYVVRFHIGSYPSTLLEVLIGLTVVAWFVEKIKNQDFKLQASSFQLPIVLFLIAAMISVIASPDKKGGLGIFKAYFIEPLLIYLVIKDVVKSKKDWHLVFSALVFSGLWVALLAVFQGLIGWLTFAPHEAALGRAHAVYNTANAAGLYLGPIVFLLLGAVRGLKGVKGIKETTVGGVALMVLAILLSKSAGAVVGLVGGLGILAILGFLGTRRGMRVVGVIGLVLATVGIWFFFNISSFTPKNVDPYVRKSTDTLQFRFCLWEGTRNLLLERPVFGAGLSGFKELYSQRYFTCDAEPLEYPHNWVLNFWVETGALGLIAFLLILWRYYKTINGYMATWLHGQEGGAEEPFSHLTMQLCFFAAMVYWLIHGLVDVPYFKNDLSLEFWVIMGLVETLGFTF